MTDKQLTRNMTACDTETEREQFANTQPSPERVWALYRQDVLRRKGIETVVPQPRKRRLRRPSTSALRTLCERVKARRLSLGLSQVEVGKITGKGTLRKIETGDSRRPKQRTIELLAKALHCSVSYLLPDYRRLYGLDLVDDYAQRILSARIELGLSQGDVCRDTGISQCDWSQWERGLKRIPATRIDEVGEYLGVELRR